MPSFNLASVIESEGHYRFSADGKCPRCHGIVQRKIPRADAAGKQVMQQKQRLVKDYAQRHGVNKCKKVKAPDSDVAAEHAAWMAEYRSTEVDGSYKSTCPRCKQVMSTTIPTSDELKMQNRAKKRHEDKWAKHMCEGVIPTGSDGDGNCDDGRTWGLE